MNNIKLSIHPLFVLLGLALFLAGQGFLFVAWTITMILHEMAHAHIARTRGFSLNEISLMPYGAQIGGAMNGCGIRDEIIIALAGPLFNIAIALLFSGLFWFFPAIYFFSEAFVFANLMTATINLLPVFPMDGGRVLLALLSQRLQRKRAIIVVRRIGFISGLSFLAGFLTLSISGIVFNATIAVLGSFMVASAMASFRNEGYSRLIAKHLKAERLNKTALDVKHIIVSKDTTLSQLSLLMTGNGYYKVSVADNNLNELFVLSETEVDELMLKNSLWTKVGSLREKNGAFSG